MANRNTLSVNQVEKFKEYLVAEGWELQEPKGDYEVLRATKEGRKHTEEHKQKISEGVKRSYGERSENGK